MPVALKHILAAWCGLPQVSLPLSVPVEAESVAKAVVRAVILKAGGRTQAALRDAPVSLSRAFRLLARNPPPADDRPPLVADHLNHNLAIMMVICYQQCFPNLLEPSPAICRLPEPHNLA